MAYLAWSAIHGLAALWLGGPLREQDERPFEQVADAVADLLTTALAGGRTSRSRAPAPSSGEARAL